MPPAIRWSSACPPVLVAAAALAAAASLQAHRTPPVLDLEPHLYPVIVEVPPDFAPLDELRDRELAPRST